MKRRGFSTLIGLLLAGFAGCTSEGGPPPRPWTSSDPIESDGKHDLHFENRTETTEAAWLRVRREDGTVLIDGRYELPDGRGIRFRDVGDWETTYRIDVAIDGDEVRSIEWYTESCADNIVAPNGSRNAAVVISNDVDENRLQLSVTMDQCDALMAGRLPTGEAEYFRLDEERDHGHLLSW